MADLTHQNPSMGKAPVFSATGASAVPRRFPPMAVFLFLMGMVVPVWFQVGPLLLMPHRIVLLLLFVPLGLQLLMGRAGRIGSYDWLILFATVWAVLAIAMNENYKGQSNVQPIGIHVLETLGAYLLGRVAIRSRDDFVAFVRAFFWVLVVLVPFGVIEAVTHRAVMLELIPKSVSVVYTEHRWGLRRAQTVFGHPILFGVFSGIGFGLFWYVLRSKFQRIAGAGLAAAGTFFSLSTGALISITIQMSLMAWEKLTSPHPRRWTIFACVCVTLYVVIDLLSNRTPFHVLITYATFNTGSAYNRILIWRYGMENVWANPWFGLGENVFTWTRPNWMSSSADNFWLLWAMKYGLPSFLAMAAALTILIRKISLAPIRDPLSQACRAGYLTALGGVIIAGGTVHFWHGVMAFVMFMFGACAWVIEAGRRDEELPPDGEVAPEQPTEQGLVYSRQTVRHDRRNSKFSRRKPE